jgi:hypothetical protein
LKFLRFYGTFLQMSNANEQLVVSNEQSKTGSLGKSILSLLFATCSLFFLFSFPVFAQNNPAPREDLWVCPVFESGMYSVSNLAIGGGVALGYGDRLAFGLKVIYWNDMEEVRSLELNFLTRFYFFNKEGALALAPSGPFIQFNIGPVIFAWDEQNITMPSETVMTSAGLSLGWRFLFGRYFFIEPAIRGGIPYLFGAGLSAGVRF